MSEQPRQVESVYTRLGGCIGLCFVIAIGGVVMLNAIDTPRSAQARTDRPAPAEVPLAQEVPPAEPVKIDLYDGTPHDPEAQAEKPRSRVTSPQVRHLFSSVRRDD